MPEISGFGCVTHCTSAEVTRLTLRCFPSVLIQFHFPFVSLHKQLGVSGHWDTACLLFFITCCQSKLEGEWESDSMLKPWFSIDLNSLCSNVLFWVRVYSSRWSRADSWVGFKSSSGLLRYYRWPERESRKIPLCRQQGKQTLENFLKTLWKYWDERMKGMDVQPVPGLTWHRESCLWLYHCQRDSSVSQP